ncbi:hypothetical protein [Pectobacterium parvum]|uniref:Uncharacterized protein n=1 Tax=Pectobacterium parvum TaxID=2778550 RepID=A0AAP9IM69_9GAMM|nr:hypothetical protein [Pectobacterium parvum]QHQ25878.1 hypothetical protein GMX10_18965 [Pectobacterium parvum]
MVTCSYAQLRYVSTLVAKFAHQRISLRITAALALLAAAYPRYYFILVSSNVGNAHV